MKPHSVVYVRHVSSIWMYQIIYYATTQLHRLWEAHIIFSSEEWSRSSVRWRTNTHRWLYQLSWPVWNELQRGTLAMRMHSILIIVIAHPLMKFTAVLTSETPLFCAEHVNCFSSCVAPTTSSPFWTGNWQQTTTLQKSTAAITRGRWWIPIII